MKILKPNLDYYVNKLKNNEPFQFARYGDGEWLTILYAYNGPARHPDGTVMKNSNGCTFTLELGQALRQVLFNKHPYQHAILKIAHRRKGDEITGWLADNHVQIDWYNGDLFLEESLQGNLFPLIEQIREKRVLYVGNERLKGLNMKGLGFFPYVAYIVPPVKNSYTAINEIISRASTAIEKRKIDFIGWSAGLASKVFIDIIYERYPEVTQIDFGSQFDGYFKPLEHIKEKWEPRYGDKAASRSYIRKGNHDWKELLRLNTGR